MDLKTVKKMQTELSNRQSKLEVTKSAVAEIGLLEVKTIDAEEQSLEVLRDEIFSAQIELINLIFERVETQNARDVLIARYVRCEPFGAISAELNLSESAIYKLHRQGVREFTSAEMVYKSLHFQR